MSKTDWYTSQPGDHARLVEIPPDGAYFSNDEEVHGVTLIVRRDYMITYHSDGWFGFTTDRKDSPTLDTFYKVRVARVEESKR